MNPALLAALINEIAIPELTAWLRGLHASGEVVTEELIIKKLMDDANFGIQIGNAWLAAHPPTP